MALEEVETAGEMRLILTWWRIAPEITEMTLEEVETAGGTRFLLNAELQKLWNLVK